MSKHYRAIWEELKLRAAKYPINDPKAAVRVRCNAADRKAIAKAVTREKDEDVQYKAQCNVEFGYTLYMNVTHEVTALTFRLCHSRSNLKAMDAPLSVDDLLGLEFSLSADDLLVNAMTTGHKAAQSVAAQPTTQSDAEESPNAYES